MFDRRAARELAAAKPGYEIGDVAAADVYVPGDDGEAIDWRGGRLNRQRLDADALRDSVLATSGTLNVKAGGPPVAVPLTVSRFRCGWQRRARAWTVTNWTKRHRF